MMKSGPSGSHGCFYFSSTTYQKFGGTIPYFKEKNYLGEFQNRMVVITAHGYDDKKNYATSNETTEY